MTNRVAAMAAMFGILALGLPAQDEGKKKVEGPLKQTVAPPAPDAAKIEAVEQPVLKSVKSPPPAKFDLSKTGIEWHRGLDQVLQKGKPILLLQILGNYDDVYC